MITRFYAAALTAAHQHQRNLRLLLVLLLVLAVNDHCEPPNNDHGRF